MVSRLVFAIAATGRTHTHRAIPHPLWRRSSTLTHHFVLRRHVIATPFNSRASVAQPTYHRVESSVISPPRVIVRLYLRIADYYQRVVPLYNYETKLFTSQYPSDIADWLEEGMALSKRGDSKHIERCFLNAIGCLHDRGLGRLNEHLVTIRVKCAELMWNTKTNEGQIDAIFLLRRLQKALETWYGEDETTVYKSQLRVAFGLGKLLARGGERQEGEGLMTDVAEEILKERMRREEVEVDIAEEGEWFDDKETLEVLGALGKHYVDTNQHKLAYPVYQQKLSLLPPSSLETVLAMNAYALSYALQDIRDTRGVAGQKSLETAIEFQQRAKGIIDKIRASPEVSQQLEYIPERYRCDYASAEASYNLGLMEDSRGHIMSAELFFRKASSAAIRMRDYDLYKKADYQKSKLLRTMLQIAGAGLLFELGIRF